MAAFMMAGGVAAAGPGATGYANYPTSVERAFIKGCVQGGGSRAACKCVIRKIERRYSLRRFLQIVTRVNETGDFPSAIDRMINSCAARYG
jgi:hypothetical protein